MKKIKILLFVTFLLLFVPTINLKADIFMNVSGRLLDYDTGKGIPNASILIFPYHLAETDKDGKFVFNELPEDQYTIDIESTICSIHEFYVPYQYPENIIVGKGKNVANFTIYLKKGLEISGRIFTEDGVTPIAGAKISIGSEQANYYGKIMSNYSHTTSLLTRLDFFSDDQGNFKVKGLLEKIPFHLYIEANGFADEKISNNIVEYGVDPTKLNIIMGKKGKAIAQGIVVSSIDNKPVSGVTIYFNGKKEIAGIYGTAVTDMNGKFVVRGLPAGLYEINYLPAKADWGKYSISAAYMWLSMQVFENKENFIKITLFPEETENITQEKKKNNFLSTNTILMSESANTPPAPKNDCSCSGVSQLVESWKFACIQYSNVMQDNSTNPKAKNIIETRVLLGCGSNLISCMLNFCDKPEFTFKCEKCPIMNFPDGSRGRPCGTIAECKDRSSNEIIICTQGDKMSQFYDCAQWDLKVLIFHETVHRCVCMEIAGSKSIDCNEVCAHLLTALVFSNKDEFYWFNAYKKKCSNAIF